MVLGSNTSGHIFDTTLSANGVLYSDASGVVTSTAVGTATHVLTSNGTGLAPTFQAAAAGGVTGPGSSTDRAIATWNGTGGTALFNNSSAVIDSSGRFTNTSQPAFQATIAGGASNVTGDATTYQVAWSATVFDQASNFTTGSSAHFTAPVTGIYLLSTHLSITGVTVAQNVIIQIVTTSKTYTIYFEQTSVAGVVVIGGSVLANMSATDTAYIIVTVDGGLKTAGIQSSASNSGFYGYLVC